MGGTAVWPYGFDIEPKLVADEVNFLEEPEALFPTVVNITTQQHGNVFAEAYVDNFLEAVQLTESDVRLALERVSAAINVALGGASGLVTDYVARNSFEGQLKTVATYISMRQSCGVERDFFYLSFGGWDNHRNMKARTSPVFGRIHGELEGFVAEMRAPAVWDSVVFVSASDFARTLHLNGDGNDHAWGADHFNVGGAVELWECVQQVFGIREAWQSTGSWTWTLHSRVSMGECRRSHLGVDGRRGFPDGDRVSEHW